MKWHTICCFYSSKTHNWFQSLFRINAVVISCSTALATYIYTICSSTNTNYSFIWLNEFRSQSFTYRSSDLIPSVNHLPINVYFSNANSNINIWDFICFLYFLLHFVANITVKRNQNRTAFRIRNIYACQVGIPTLIPQHDLGGCDRQTQFGLFSVVLFHF